MASEEPHDHPSEAEQDRRRRWSDLPSTGDPEEMTTSEPSSSPPELVDDPDREFFIRHAGWM